MLKINSKYEIKIKSKKENITQWKHYLDQEVKL